MNIIHHVSIINRQAEPAFLFYRNILGLNLTMKTINQDEHRMYHLFFGDETGRPGSEVTIFEINQGPNKQFGTNQIERLMFKVPSVEALEYFQQRFDEQQIEHYGIEDYAGRKILRFEGPDHTGLGLAVMHAEENLSHFSPAKNTNIPENYRILSIDSVHVRTQYAQATARELKRMYSLTNVKAIPYFNSSHNVTILSNQEATMMHEIHIIQDETTPISKEGIGSIHHFAMSTHSIEDLTKFVHDLNIRNITNSDIKDREFFQSVYYRDPNNLLIEIATMNGQSHQQPNQNAVHFKEIPLLLPDYLEHLRSEIELGLVSTKE